MKKPPVIVVQLVHIQGPMKGEIQEFSESEISIGRHASCLLQFPRDLTMISRKHANIIREGNRFKLIDSSTNGTFVNGKRIQETYLKNGDVLTFTEGGPKVSFLSQIKESQVEIENELTSDFQEKSLPPFPRKEVLPHHQKEEQVSFDRLPEATPIDPHPQPELKRRGEVSTQKTKVPLIIQYGPTLRSFNEVPVTMGKDTKCDFKLNHPVIFDQHAQIFFHEDQYWVKDLTGKGLISINNCPIGLQAPLNSDDHLALSPKGPHFRFLGGGRLAEFQEPSLEDPTDSQDRKEKNIQGKKTKREEIKGPLSILKNILKR